MKAPDPQRFAEAWQQVQDATDLRIVDKAVYALIAAWGPDEPISYADIASNSRDSAPTAMTAVKNLKAAGYLEVLEKSARVHGKIHGSRYAARIPDEEPRCAA